MTSLPAWGSDSPKAARSVPVADAGQVALLLLLGAGDHDRPGGQPGQQEHQRRGVRVLGHLLDGQGQPEDPGPRAPVLERDAQAEQAGVAERLEDVGRVGTLLVDGPGPRLDLVLGQAPHGIAELEQLVGEVEMHRRRLSDLPARYFLILDPRRTRDSDPAEPDESRQDHRPSPGPTSRPSSGTSRQEGAEAPAPLAAAHPVLRSPSSSAVPPSGPAASTSTPTTASTRSRRSTPSTWSPQPPARQALQPAAGRLGLPGLRRPTRPRSRPSATRPTPAASAATSPWWPASTPPPRP